MIAQTERLILRRYRESDLQDLYEYLSNPRVVEFEPHKPMTMEEVQGNLTWRISTEEMIAVELKANHKMIGNVYLGKRDFLPWSWDMSLTKTIGNAAMHKKAVKS